MSQQEQQNLPDVLGAMNNMNNGSALGQNGQDSTAFLFSNASAMIGSHPGGTNPMMGQMQNPSPMMQPMQGGMGTNQQPQQQTQPQQPPQLPQPPQQQSNSQLQLPQQQSTQNQQNFNLNELKRLQQLQQFSGQGGGPQTGLLGITGQQQVMNQQAILLQSMLGGMDQKVQNPRFESNPVFNPMFQPAIMQDARLLMAQSQFPMAMQNMGDVPLPSPHSLFHRDGSRRMRGGVIEPFPEKLHRLLLEVEAAGRSDVISFVANGRAFAIHKPDKFFKEIVPLYFRQSRLSSFKRQLNLYGFELINTGPSRGGYFHELFIKDRPELCRRMRRVAVKVSGSSNKDAHASGDKSPQKQQPEPRNVNPLDLDSSCGAAAGDESISDQKERQDF